jgi:hypothetical protein
MTGLPCGNARSVLAFAALTAAVQGPVTWIYPAADGNDTGFANSVILPYRVTQTTPLRV